VGKVLVKQARDRVVVAWAVDTVLALLRVEGMVVDKVLAEALGERVVGMGLPLEQVVDMVLVEASLEQVEGMAVDMVLAEASGKELRLQMGLA